MSSTRAEIWNTIRADRAFDVIVVGGGVNGIAAYRDLSLQGLRVLLVEAQDFASGCSAAPSRMIHGGLRYLENGEFDLVRESLVERDALLRNAPHMVQPLPTVVPLMSLLSGLFNSALSFFGYQGRPARRGLLPVKLGLSLYDLLTRSRRQMPRHQIRGRAATRAKWPDLLPDLRYSATYFDAWVSHPERLCIELLQDAGPEGLALNYARICGTGQGLTLRDQRSDQSLEVTAKLLVNATGAWLDGAAQELGAPERPAMVSGTKGSHLILDNPALHDALGGHMAYFENTDGRVCILFPYLGKVLAGSTDIRVSRPGRVRCEPEEQAYILDSVRLVFPTLRIEPGDVVFSYSGIRPLPQSDQDFTGRISRGHDMRWLHGPVPQLCMIGGKWTTFRAFGAQVTDEVLAHLGRDRLCGTLNRPIGGGDSFPDDPQELTDRLMQVLRVSPERAAHLVGHYGTRAMAVLQACAGCPEDQPLRPGCAYTRAEIAYLARQEHCETLSDLVLRRSSVAITGALDGALLDQMTAAFARAKGLSDHQSRQQRAALVTELVSYHGLAADRLAPTHVSRSKTWP